MAGKKNVSARPRERSPNYPAVGFKTALELAQKIWAAEKRHPMTPTLAVRRMGYMGLNGKSTVVLSALRKFGLIEGSGVEVKIADEAIPLMVLPVDAPERPALIRSMALRPQLFQEVLADSGEALPSDENLKARLQMNLNFTETAAETVVRALRETVEFLSGLPPTPVPLMPPAGSPTDPLTAPGAATSAFSPLFLPPEPAVARPVSQPSPPEVHVWSLGSDVRAELRLSGRAGPKHMEMLKRYVGLLAESVAAEEVDPLG
jgi:hypothetical protein